MNWAPKIKKNIHYFHKYYILKYFPGWKSRDSVPMLVEQYMEKKLMVDEFVTFTKSFPEINEAFDLLHQGKALRTVILMA